MAGHKIWSYQLFIYILTFLFILIKLVVKKKNPLIVFDKVIYYVNMQDKIIYNYFLSSNLLIFIQDIINSPLR
jgi:hypothetical protein